MISICLIAAGTASAADGEVAETRAVDRQELMRAAAIADGEAGNTLRTPVRSVASLRMLPDGTMVRECDVVRVRVADAGLLEPEGAWINLSREIKP